MQAKYFKRAAIFVILGWCIACKKQVLVDYQSIPADSVHLSIDPTQPGLLTPPNFTGLSFETALLPEADLSEDKTVLIRLYKLLSTQGLIRVGGSSVDNIFWTNTPRNNSKNVDSLYTDDVAHLFGFAKATGWKVIFGLNLAQSTPSKAAEEAGYIIKTAADSPYLDAFEIGNEPDQYVTLGLRPTGYSYTDFQKEWNNFYTTIHAAVPAATFAGPATASELTWLLPFIGEEQSRLKMATHHYYRMGPPSSSTVTVTRLLTPDDNLLTELTEAVAASRGAGIPFRMDECNSVYDGGKKGVSNTFASALWGLDYMFNVAQSGAAGVNFHGGSTEYYTPITIDNTAPVAEPLFYGMLCFQLGSQGRFIPTILSNPNNLNMTAYAVLSTNGKIFLTVINKNSTTNANITLHNGTPISEASYVTLTASSLTATSGVALGGHSIKSDGTFTTPTFTPITQFVSGDVLITVPAASAMVIELH